MATLPVETTQPCGTCRAEAGQPCRASAGNEGTHVHSARRQAYLDATPDAAYQQGRQAMLEWAARQNTPGDLVHALSQRSASVDHDHPYNRGAIDVLAELVEDVGR